MLKRSKSFRLSLAIGIVLALSLAVSPAQALVVPYYSQPNWYYCGPACLEMVFDYYGPDIPQVEIADAARTDSTFPSPFGSYTYELRRAAHFSNLSTSQGNELPGAITGYTARGLGYAAFERTYCTIADLESLIDAGYPVVVLQMNALNQLPQNEWGHFRVVVDYDAAAQTITVHDPLPQSWTGPGKDTSWGGPNNVYTYADFNTLWAYSGRWALVTFPWDVSISSVPASVAQGATFTVTATITYPRPAPFSAAYPASSSEATIQLPAGLSLAAGETSTKSLGTILSGGSATVDWDVDAVSAGGPYTITVEGEGNVTGSVSGHAAGVFTTGYTYTDRIGGSNTAQTTVTGVVPPYDVTIDAYCNTEAASVGVAITMDGNPTGFNTPSTFAGLTGSHTFTVPSADPSGHPFKEWSTGETTTTITVNSAGTYVAYYEAAVGPSVPEFGLSFSIVTSLCAMLYLLIRKQRRIR